MSEDTENKILNLLSTKDGYERGFSLLVKTYQERLYWHIRGMLGQHDDADEVLQKTFIKVFKGIAGFQRNSKLYTWLYRIASNESLSFLAKKQKNRLESLDDNEGSDVHKLSADVYIDNSETDKLLGEAIALLPDKQRQVFLLRYYDEMSYQDISEISGTSVGALKASYHHAAKKIEYYILNRKA
jgi:RNA polymerase sigma-70 factor (ECF subfamily)